MALATVKMDARQNRDVGSEVSTQSKVIDPMHALEPRLFSSLRPSQSPSQSYVPQIGLALSGGFARGIAHIGVLKVLEEENIPIRFVAGSSFGAFIGAIYCAGATTREMIQIACSVRRRHFAQLSISRYGLFSSRRMIKFLNKILKVRNFEELEIPLAVTTTEISTGEGIVFRSGPLAEAIRASCAYPGVFPPVDLNGRLLVDGGLTYPVPTQPLSEMRPDRIIAVHLRARTGLGGPRNMFDVLAKSFSIAEQRSGMLWQSLADLVVEPEVRQFKYDDFERAPELVRAGEKSMRAALPSILEWFEEKINPEILEPAMPAFIPSTL